MERPRSRSPPPCGWRAHGGRGAGRGAGRHRRRQRRPGGVRPRRRAWPGRAEAVDAAVAAGDPGPFAGVPIGVKDLEDCAGMPGYGSLPSPGARRRPTRSTSPGCGPPGRCRWARRRPRVRHLNFTKTKVAPRRRSPGPRHDPGGSSGEARRRWPPAVRPPRPATGAVDPDPGAFCGLVVQAELRAHPLHRCHRVRDIGQGPAHHHRRRQRPPPGRHRGPRRPRPLLAAPTAGVLRVGGRVATVEGLRGRWSPDLGTFLCDPRCGRRRGRPASWRGGRAGPRRRAGVPDRPGAGLAGRRIPRPVAVDRGRHVAGGGRRLHPLHAPCWSRPSTTRCRVVAAVRRREALVEEVAALFDEVDVLITPTTAVPAFPAEGPPPDTIDGQPARPLGASATPSRCWPTCAGTRRCPSPPA